MPDFEWDNNKNESNKKKHGLSFEQGSKVFGDSNRLQKISVRGTERRYLTIGKAFKVFVTVVYTVRKPSFSDHISKTVTKRRTRCLSHEQFDQAK